MKNPLNPTKSQLSFSSQVASLDQLEAESTLTAISEAASKLAAVIAHRIESPDGRKEANAHLFQEGKATPKSRRRASLNQRPERTLSLWDRQDIFQEVNAFLWEVAPDGRKLTYEELSRLFQNCRKLLKMDGGKKDVSRCDTLDEAIHFAEIGSLDSIDRHSPQRLAFAAKLKSLRRWLWKGFAADTSRKRKSSYRLHAATLRRVAAHGNPFSVLTCPPIDPACEDRKNSDLNRAFIRFRAYASIPKAPNLHGLAEAMTSLA